MELMRSEQKPESLKPEKYTGKSAKEESEQLIKASIINFDDDEDDLLPTNKRIEEVFDFHSDLQPQKRVSVMEDFEPGHRSLRQHPRQKDSCRSSLISSSSDFSNCDKISERLADIVMLRDEHKEQSERNLEGRKRGHKKNVLTMNRVLPSKEEFANYLQVRPPPEEEFFLMTLMCYKLNHQHFGKICDINGQKLYLKAAKELKVPLFKFPEFIEKELDKIYLDMMYRRRKKKHMQKPKKPLTTLMKKQRLRVKQVDPAEQHGKILDDDYDLDDSYF